uniref:Uncharacterized protein n=1 Tax=Rhizophora mucronata TaxID=61149 RepID=A0A2P2PKM9_RHIMU
MMRWKDTSGCRISMWASPFELHAGVSVAKMCLKPQIFIVQVQFLL